MEPHCFLQPLFCQGWQRIPSAAPFKRGFLTPPIGLQRTISERSNRYLAAATLFITLSCFIERSLNHMWLLYWPSLMYLRKKGSLESSIYTERDGNATAVISYALRVGKVWRRRCLLSGTVLTLPLSFLVALLIIYRKDG